MNPLVEGVWLESEPIRIVGMRLDATMAVLRLADGSVLVYSPVRLTPERRAAAESIGRVSHLYAPNTFHHLWMGDWAEAFPDATVHAPAGLARKRPELRIDRVHGTAPEPDFDGEVEEHPIGGFRLEESALFHRSSRTLVVADLLHNVGRPADAWSRFYTRAMGFYDRPALSRMIRWTGFSDRAAARRSIDALLALPFEVLVVAHGAPLREGARAALASAFEWLPAAS